MMKYLTDMMYKMKTDTVNEMRSEMVSKGDLAAVVAPVTSRLDSLESRISQIESAKDSPMSDGPEPSPAARPGAPPRSSRRATSAASASIEQHKRPPAASPKSFQLILKGVERPLTRTIWKEVYDKMIEHVPMSREETDLMTYKPQNERASLFIGFPTIEALRAYKTAFDASNFGWLDEHTGETVFPRLQRDQPEHIRKKTARIQYLYEPAWALLRKSSKYVKGTHNLTISGGSESVQVRDARDIWYLFTRQGGVMKPNYKDCERMGIDRAAADKFIEENVSPLALVGATSE
jgi:hypothetical protein